MFLGVVLAALVIETSFLPVFLASPFKPDLMLVIMVFVALRGSYGEGAPAALVLGLVKDSFSGLYLGLNVFTFLVIFITIKCVADRLYAESASLFVFAVTVATLACMSANLLLLLFTNSSGIAFSMGSALIPHLLTNALAASLVTLLPGFEQEAEAA